MGMWEKLGNKYTSSPVDFLNEVASSLYASRDFVKEFLDSNLDNMSRFIAVNCLHRNIEAGSDIGTTAELHAVRVIRASGLETELPNERILPLFRSTDGNLGLHVSDIADIHRRWYVIFNMLASEDYLRKTVNEELPGIYQNVRTPGWHLVCHRAGLFYGGFFDTMPEKRRHFVRLCRSSPRTREIVA